MKSGAGGTGAPSLYDSGRVRSAMNQFGIAHGKDVVDAEWPFKGRRGHAAVLALSRAEAEASAGGGTPHEQE